jgi:hypothetical protein
MWLLLYPRASKPSKILIPNDNNLGVGCFREQYSGHPDDFGLFPEDIVCPGGKFVGAQTDLVRSDSLIAYKALSSRCLVPFNSNTLQS